MNNTYQSPLAVITEQLTLTEDWQKLGVTQDVKGFTALGLFLDITINNSEGVQIKIIGRTNSDDETEYLLPVYAVTPEGLVEHMGTHYILNKNEDQSIIIKTNTDNLIPFIDIYIKAGTIGTNPAVLNKVYTSKAWCAGGK